MFVRPTHLAAAGLPLLTTYYLLRTAYYSLPCRCRAPRAHYLLLTTYYLAAVGLPQLDDLGVRRDDVAAVVLNVLDGQTVLVVLD